MLYGRLLSRPAAAEVRQMLHRIKMDNMERGRKINTAYMEATAASGARPLVRSMPDWGAAMKQQHQPAAATSGQLSHRQQQTASKTMMEVEEMGSFTSKPKVIPSADADDHDAEYCAGAEDGGVARESAEDCLRRCERHLAGMPAPIEREWVSRTGEEEGEVEQEEDKEKFRVLQWNVLSQALGTKNDNFVRCPASALHWGTRRYRMLEEIVRHRPDVVCLQEVDHFAFLERSLSALGFAGRFLPKPDSPCLYLQDNSGPDGCAIFYNAKKFDLESTASRVIEVWHVESNQVCLLAKLRSRKTNRRLVVATTHLKARNGALLSTLRNEQGKDLLNFVKSNSEQEGKDEARLPVVLTGDFNAEPEEPVYDTITQDEDVRLTSAYASPSDGSEPAYTTWKVREDGEHIQTLDYVFHTPAAAAGLRVEGVLGFPGGDRIGDGRLPSEAFASDHLSLVADFSFA